MARVRRIPIIVVLAWVSVDVIDGRDGTDVIDGRDGIDVCVNGETVTNCELP